MSARQTAEYALAFGSILYVLGQYEKALQNFEHSMTISRRHQLTDLLILAYNEAAWCFINLKLNEKAVQYVTKAHDLAKLTKDPYLLAYTFTAISGVQSGSGRAEPSKEAARESIRLFKSLGYDYHLEVALFNLGMAYHNEGQKQQAKPILQEAQNLALKIEDTSTYNYSLFVLGRILESEGKTEEALQNYLKATAFFYQEQDFATFLEAVGSIAPILILRKEKTAAQDYIAKAESWWKKTDPEQKSTSVKIKIHYLKQIYEKHFGTPESHNKVLHEFLTILKNRIAELEKKVVATSSAEMELEFKEEQNRILKQVNDLQSEQIRNLVLIRSLFIFSLLAIFFIIALLVYSLRTSQKIRQQKTAVDRILQNIQEGIVTFRKDYKLHGQYSQFAKEIFGQGRSELTGLPLKDLFSAFGREGESLWNETSSTLSATWDEESLAWELNLSNLPVEAQLHQRTYQLRWNPVFEHNKLQEIMLILNDNTELVTAKAQESAKNLHIQTLTKAMTELFSVNTRRAILLVQELNQRDHWQAMLDSKQASLWLRTLHTWKGNCRTLGLRSLAQTIHQLETAVNTHSNVENSIVQVQETLQSYLSFVDEIGADSQKTLPERSALEIIDSINLDLEPYIKRLGFPGIDLQLDLALPSWDRSMGQLFSTLCLHALTNSVEHGYVLGYASLAQQKPRIELGVKIKLVEEHKLQWQFCDRGVGINWDKIASLAALHQFEPEKNRPLTDILFLDQVSTATQLSERSGRGVGLSAIAAETRRFSGDYKLLDQEQGPGSRLIIEFPYPLREFNKESLAS